jgi:iron complex outermembrane recepter protein
VLFDIRNQLLQSQNTFRKFQDVTPKAALNYKITPSFALYGSYGYSFDSPAGNELDDYPRPYDPFYSIKLINPDLNAQESLNMEVGAKGFLLSDSKEFINSLYFDLSLFNTIIKNEIVPFEVLGEYYFRNSAKTNRRGIELGLTTGFLKRFNWSLAYTYNNFNYSDYSALAISFEGGDIISSEKDYSGNIVPSVPEHLISNELGYNFNLFSRTNMFLKLNHMYVSSMYMDDANSDRTKSYSLINSALGFEFKFNRFNILLTGNLNNITDELYVGFININSATRRFYEPGEPRSFYSTLRFNYNF